jgi:hypothetical protein
MYFLHQDILHNTSFEPREVPSSVYLLEQMEKMILPGVKRYCYKDKGGVDVYHFDILELLAIIFDKEEHELIKEFVFNYQQNEGIISHPCNSDCWAEYETYKNALEVYHNKSFYLLMPIIAADEFLAQKSR